MRPSRSSFMRFWKTPHTSESTEYWQRRADARKARRKIAQKQPEQTSKQQYHHSHQKRTTTMGQINKSNATYISVSEGQFICACEKGKHNIERTGEDGKTKYGFATNSFTGTLTNITIEDSQWGKQYLFHWADDDGTYKMPMKYGGNLANSFLNGLAGVIAKHGKMVWLQLTAKAKLHNGKTYTNIFISDSSENIKWKYDWKTDIPPVTVKKNRKGEDVVDDEKRLEFFDNVLNNEILPALQHTSESAAKLGLAEGQPSNLHDEEIPF